MGGNVVIGRRVDEVKVERARELRRRMTPAERVLWRRLRTNRLGGAHFRRQQVIEGFIVDFYCHAAGLVVEVDGSVHEHQPEYDAGRDRALAGLGLRVLRIPNAAVGHDLPRVLDQIAAHVREGLRFRLPDGSGTVRGGPNPYPLPYEGRGT